MRWYDNGFTLLAAIILSCLIVASIARGVEIFQPWETTELHQAGDVHSWRIVPSGSYYSSPAEQFNLEVWEFRRVSGVRWEGEDCSQLQLRVGRGYLISEWSHPLVRPQGCVWVPPTPVPEPSGHAPLGAGVVLLALLLAGRRLRR